MSTPKRTRFGATHVEVVTGPPAPSPRALPAGEKGAELSGAKVLAGREVVGIALGTIATWTKCHTWHFSKHFPQKYSKGTHSNLNRNHKFSSKKKKESKKKEKFIRKSNCHPCPIIKETESSIASC